MPEIVRVFEPEPQPIRIKPAPSSWETLVKKLEPVINLGGVWSRVRRLYDQGYGPELETAAEIALATATKETPFSMFSVMVGAKNGNWEPKTLPKVRETWEVRRHALEVMTKLKLKAESTNAILALAWRLKGTIMRFLGIATEQGTGIRNPAGVFFALTRRQATSA